MRRVGVALAAVALVALAAAGLWRASSPPAATEARRVDEVAAGLRCPTCQGLSVKDSSSQVAQSMRAIIGEQLGEGRTPDQVRTWFVGRYGSWILLTPESSGLGWLVWVLPVAAVGAGAAAALLVLRRRSTAGAVEEHDQEAVEEALLAAERGAIEIPGTPDGERLESSLLLLASVRADRSAGLSSAAAEALATQRVAGALAAARAVPSPQPGPQVARRSGRRVPVGLRWAGVTAGFVLVVSGVLAVNTAERGAGQLITGNLPNSDATPEMETGGSSTAGGDTALDGLRAAVAAAPEDRAARLALARALSDAGRLDEAAAEYREVLVREPEDARTRLLLAAALLQTGDLTGARTEVDAVLAAQPDDPDALLLSGIVQNRQGDPSSGTTLRRFLALAPGEHPGREVAETLLGADTP